MENKKEGSLLPRLSVYRPVTVTMILVALLVLGLIAYLKIPLEMMPSGYDAPFMGVWVPYPNATPEEIQDRITRPVEDIIGTVRNVDSTGASIRNGFTFVRIHFNQGTDMEMAYAEVRDRMDRVMAELPEDVERVFIRRFNMDEQAEISIPFMINKDVPDLYYFLDRHIGRQLMRQDGVASVEFEGVDEKQFEIELKQDSLSSHRINLFESLRELRDTNFSMPSGFVREGGRRFYIRSVGQFSNIEELKKVEIKPGILLGDIADVQFRPNERSRLTRVDGNKGIWLSVYKESGANTVEVHNRVMATLEDAFANDPGLEGISMGEPQSQGQLIMDSITDLQETAIWAGFFAIIVLFFFLRHLRMTLVITLAIPLSLLITLIIMYFTGETLNLLSMMGLMISVGLVIDNSVVVLENIFRHRKAGDSPRKAAITGASEVALAVVMATSTTIVVFLPMILMGQGSMMGFFMERLGFPVIFSLVSSLFVALIFIPLTTTLFKDKGKIGNSKLIDGGRELYSRLLRWTLDHRVETVIISLSFLLLIFFTTTDLGYQGEQRRRNGSTIRIMLGKKYKDLESYPLELTKKVEDWAFKHKDRLGFDVVASRVHDNMIRVSLNSSNKQDSVSLLEKPIIWFKNIFMLKSMVAEPEMERRKFVRDNLMKDLNVLPGEARMSMGWGGSGGERNQISLVLTGNDYKELRKWGQRVQDELRRLPGILDVDTDDEVGNEELHVLVNRERAVAANVNLQFAAQMVGNAFRGAQLPKFQEKDREINVVMRLRDQDRETVENLKNLRIPTQDGREVALSTIAAFEYTRGSSSIRHDNRKPNYNITISGEGKRMDRLYPLVSGAMKNLGNGEGYTYSYGQDRRRMMQDQGNFVFSAILAVVFVFLLMGVLFESFALPLTIIATVPFAFAGSQLLLKIYNMPANLFAYIGIIIIVGVVVNNGIVLVDLINRLRAQGIARREAIMQAGFYRFRPILMTAGTTIFSLIPMAFGDTKMVGMPYNPLGMVLVGGLALNTLLSLYLVPVFYTFFDDLKKVWGWSLRIIFGSTSKKLAKAGASASATK